MWWRVSVLFVVISYCVSFPATVFARSFTTNRVSVETPAEEPFFVENKGQLEHHGVRYVAEAPGLEVGFSKGHVFFNAPTWRESDEGHPLQTGGVLFSLLVGDGEVEPIALEPQTGETNFLRDPDPQAWVLGARHYGRILYRDVYPEIDLVYFFDDNKQLTYEFLVKPGGDPSQIEMRYDGVDGIQTRGDAFVDITTSVGRLLDGRLLCYQDIDSERQAVLSEFRKTGDASYTISLLESHDPSKELVIDPAIAFSSYWGSGVAENRTVVLDAQGNIYMSGGSRNPSWPTTQGAYDTSLNGSAWPDVTVAKFNPNGNVIWSTFIGGPNEDYAYVSAVNAAGELYVAGRAGSGFPTTAGAYDRTFNGGIGAGNIHSPTDAFVLKLAANGRSLVYSTYIGGNGDENGRAIHLRPGGQLLVAGGNTSATNMPTTMGALKRNPGGNRDAWVAELSANGRDLNFLTYFGPNNDTELDETIRALGTDLNGNVWIGGTTTGTDIQTTPNAFQRTRRGARGNSDSFIAKISSDGRNLLYFSWLGGSQFDEIETEGVSDKNGNFYVAGLTGSQDFPFSPGAFQTVVKGGDGAFGGDGFVVKVNNNGSLGFATAYGGSIPGNEGFFGPVVGPTGIVYAVGRFLASSDTPITADAFQTNHGGGRLDAALVAFSPNGKEVLYATYFGGSGVDTARAVAIHPDGRSVVVVGETESSNLPLVQPPQVTSSGAFLTRFDVGDLLGPDVFDDGFESGDCTAWSGADGLPGSSPRLFPARPQIDLSRTR